MAARSQQEINDLGFKALVQALGREDAIRFVRYISKSPRGTAKEAADIEASEEVLPAMTPDQIHELIMNMHEPDKQGSFL